MKIQHENTWRILHIDDDEEDYLLTRAMLSELHEPRVEIEWAPDYEAARSRLAGNRYDAVLVDYDLGADNGIQIIQEFSPHVHAPLILYTGRGSREVDREALQAGATLYLTKDEVNPLLLERGIRYAIQLKQRENDLLYTNQRLEQELAERIRAEKALQASENKFSLFFERSAIISAVTTVPEGRLVEVNEAWVAAFGIPKEEALGKTTAELGINPDQETREKIRAQLLQTGSVRGIETRLPTRAGWRDFLLNLDLVETDGQMYAINTSQDITDRKQAQQALLESETRWREFLDSTHDNYIGLDREWRFTYANRHYSELMGISPEELIGKNYWDLFPQYIGADLERNYHRVMETGQPMHYRQGGIYTSKVYDVSVYPTSEGLAIFSIDRTGEFNYQRELEDERARLQDLLQALPVAVWIVAPDGKVLYKNTQADHVWGGPVPMSANVEGYREYVAWRLDNGDSIEAEDYPVAQALRTGQPAQPVELRIQRFDGAEGVVLAIGAPIKDREGRLAGAVAVNVDLTENKQVREAVHQSEERLREVLESTHDVVFLLDRDWRFQYVNQRFLALYQDYAADFIGKKLFDVFPRYQGTTIEAHYRVAMEQHLPVHFVLESAYNDLTYEISAYPTRDGISVFSKDITEEKLAREAQRQSEARFRDIANNISQMVWMADGEGNLFWYNRRWFEYTGSTPEEVQGRGWQKYIHPDDAREVKDRVLEKMKTGAAWEETIRVLGKDGVYCWYLIRNVPIHDDQGQVYRWFGTGTDVTDQIKLRKQLEEQNDRIRAILQALPVGVWVTDEEGRILTKNSQADCIWAGDAPLSENIEQYREYRTWDLHTGQELRPADYPLSVVLRTGQPFDPAEHIIQRFDGTRGVVIASATPLKDSQGHLSGIVAINIDITGQIEARQALVESEKKYRELAETLQLERNKLAAVIEELPVGVGVGDVQGTTLALNRAGLKLHGFNSESEMLAALEEYRGAFELLLPDGQPLPQDQWPAARAMRGDYVQDFEVILFDRRNDTQHFVVYNAGPVRDNAGAVTLIIYTMQDLTERKRAEQAMRESEASFRQLADAMPQLVWTANVDGSVDYYNQRYRLYTGIDLAPRGNWEWGPVLHPDDLQVTLDAWNHSVATGEIYQVEHRVQMADGAYRWHLSRGIPARDEHNRVYRWYGTATDIHDQKVAEQELRKSYQELERTNQALQEFTAIASHDLQEPLHKMKSFSQLLAARYSGTLGEDGRDYLNRINSAANRMTAMIQDLLTLSRVSSRAVDFSRVSLAEIVAGVLNDLEIRIAETGASVEVRDLPELEADPLQMRQLFQNLIGNALKYHRPDTPPQVVLSAHKNNNDWIIQIRDNGIGIDLRTIHRIFEPFIRGHSRTAYDGTGMGLAICKKIVERHGGSITVESEPGVGSTFSVSLPARRLLLER